MPAVTTILAAQPRHCPIFDPLALYFTEEGLKDHLEDWDLDILGVPYPHRLHLDQDLPVLEVEWIS